MIGNAEDEALGNANREPRLTSMRGVRRQKICNAVGVIASKRQRNRGDTIINRRAAHPTHRSQGNVEDNHGRDHLQDCHDDIGDVRA